MEYRSRSFGAGEVVDIDNNRFEDCTFDGCIVRYSGNGGYVIRGCKFGNITWHYDGVAWRAIEFLHALYPDALDGVSELVLSYITGYARWETLEKEAEEKPDVMGFLKAPAVRNTLKTLRMWTDMGQPPRGVIDYISGHAMLDGQPPDSIASLKLRCKACGLVFLSPLQVDTTGALDGMYMSNNLTNCIRQSCKAPMSLDDGDLAYRRNDGHGGFVGSRY